MDRIGDGKRVLLFNNSLSGGAGKSILSLASAMRGVGTDCRIVIYENRIDYSIPDGIPITILESATDSRRVGYELEKWLEKEGDFDMLISNSSPSNKILSKISHRNIWHCVRSAETKSFSGFLSGMRKRWRYAKYRRLYDGKRLITVSRGLERFIVEELGATPAEIRAIYNVFDFDEIEKLSAINDPEIPTGEYLIHVGRYDLKHKRHDILLQAYLESGVDMDLILLGEGRDREKIASLIEEMGLEKRVKMAGFKKNPYPWLKNARLLVFSSDFEGFARVLLESLYLGTPTVSTNCPTGPDEILTGDLSRFLVPVGDSRMLAKKMTEALESYPKIDRERFLHFTPEKIASSYLKLIE
jgi:glycosyltransferase involved in cell wall biosynthesis